MMMDYSALGDILHVSLPPQRITPSPRRCHPRHVPLRTQSTPSDTPAVDINSTHNPTPLVDAILERGNRTNESPFHVPGHKRGSSVPLPLTPMLGHAMRYDLTELDGLDYLSSPEGPILEAQQLAAQAWGARQTWFLVNGTTVGIHAAVMATCSGENPSQNALILARNAHQSGFNAAVLAGCAVEYALPVTAHGLAHHVTPEALESAFQRAKVRNLIPKAALVVSPTYFGVISDIAALAEVCHRYGACLIVDEAHGAHLKFLADEEAAQRLIITNRPHIHGSSIYTSSSGGSSSSSGTSPVGSSGKRSPRSQRFLRSALQEGADLVVQSTHKQLGALTQGAMLHLGGLSSSSSTSNGTTTTTLGTAEGAPSASETQNKGPTIKTSTSAAPPAVHVDPARVSRALSILQTSSPSYLIMASLDAARAQAQDSRAVATPHSAALAIHAWFNNREEQQPGEQEKDHTHHNQDSISQAWSTSDTEPTELSNDNNNKVEVSTDELNFTTERSTSIKTGLQRVSRVRLLTPELLPPGSITWHDPWRFTVLLQGMQRTGWAASAALERECGVVAELATQNSIVFAVGMGSTLEHAAALIAGLEWLVKDERTATNIYLTSQRLVMSQGGSTAPNIDGDYKDHVAQILESGSADSQKSTFNEVISHPEVVCTPREALNAAVEVVPFTAAVGRVSAELLCPYPPGVPAVCPGEKISSTVLERLRNVVDCGGKVVGAADGTLATLRVLSL